MLMALFRGNMKEEQIFYLLLYIVLYYLNYINYIYYINYQNYLTIF